MAAEWRRAGKASVDGGRCHRHSHRSGGATGPGATGPGATGSTARTAPAITDISANVEIPINRPPAKSSPSPLQSVGVSARRGPGPNQQANEVVRRGRQLRERRRADAQLAERARKARARPGCAEPGSSEPAAGGAAARTSSASAASRRGRVHPPRCATVPLAVSAPEAAV